MLQQVISDAKHLRGFAREIISTGLHAWRGMKRSAPDVAKGEFNRDPGNFGRGLYWTSEKSIALGYGTILHETVLCFQSPLVLPGSRPYLVAERYATLDGTPVQEGLHNAHRLTVDMLNPGYEGLVVLRNGEIRIVDYRPYAQGINLHPGESDEMKVKEEKS